MILDTNVVSEPKRARPDAKLVAWFERQAADQLYLTSTVVAEPAFGIGRRRRGFEIWLHERVIGAFRDRIPPFEEAEALLYGRLMAKARHAGRGSAMRRSRRRPCATASRSRPAMPVISLFFEAPLIDPRRAGGENR